VAEDPAVACAITQLVMGVGAWTAFRRAERRRG
jgi:hypothetical protein